MADRNAAGPFPWRDIWEVRSSLPHGRIARVLFCVERECIVLRHGFMQKTSPQDIDFGAQTKERNHGMKKKNIGSTFDGFLQEEGDVRRSQRGGNQARGRQAC